ncbi:MAG: disulfide bond formation protein B [Hyphomicrobiaceae bacterium]
MALSTTRIASQSAYQWASACLFAATAVILTALGFEHIGDYQPCALCLQQRYAYYVGIPALFVGLLLISLELNRVAMIIFFLTAIGFLLNTALGVYHSGVEWQFWEGPATCDSQALQPLSGGDKGLLNSISSNKSFPSCGEPAWRFLGLSFAGWNVVVCIALTIGCLKAAFASSESTIAA